MMIFSNKCQHHFPEKVKIKGERLHELSRVKVYKSQLEEVGATVIENENFQVALRWQYFKSHQGLQLTCNCYQFRRSEYCAHSWATIIAINNDLFPEAANSLEKVEIVALQSYQDTPQQNIIINEKEVLSNSTLKVLEKAINKKKLLSEQYIENNKTPLSNEVFYLVSLDEGQREDQLRISFNIREMKKDGSFSKLKAFNYTDDKVNNLSLSEDKKILTLLRRFNSFEASGHWQRQRIKNKNSLCEIPVDLLETILPLVQNTNRLAFINKDNISPLKWNPNTLSFYFNVNTEDEDWQIKGFFKDELNNILNFEDVRIIFGPNVVIYNNELRLITKDHLSDLMRYLVKNNQISIPKNKKSSQELKTFLSHTTGLEKALVPKELDLKHKYIKPQILLEVKYSKTTTGHDLWGEFFTYYNDQKLKPFSHISLKQNDKKLVFVKNYELESKAYENIKGLNGIIFTSENNFEKVRFNPSLFSDVVKSLWDYGVEVKGEGKRIIAPDTCDTNIKPQQDWFEIRSNLSFNKQRLPLPTVLQKAKDNGLFISISETEQGILPIEWLQKQLQLTSVAIKKDKNYYVHKSLSLFLENTLESEKEKNKIPGFSDIIHKLKSYGKSKSIPISKNFNGELRPYQEDSHKWFNFLQQIGIGGCLADDMGLGKTVQVLAWLQSYKDNNKKAGPHLIICPKSLIYNWKNEAKRFCPNFKIKVYGGNKSERLKSLKSLETTDIFITTYGTLRRDIEKLKEIDFEYCILDEAQAIKNDKSQTSKACCMISARNRLALTGTPVENHFGELFAIFKFLTPGLFGVKINKSNFENGQEQVIKNILRGLRPFILRRTKEEVLSELPPKTETFLVCDMEEKQANLYKELETYYQSHLNKKVKDDGIKRSKIHILEALLRMRQAACHPKLINPDFAIDESCKIKVVVEKLKQLKESGHKALVFSQFTTLLKILSENLEKEGINFSYLDGQTNNREKVVEDFKNDQTKTSFLISLKAGGFGLNLTEANYCFLLDPWWNPAVEAQAIDRTHRIGQDQKVTAYRIITKGSVEEKIIDLQKNKKDLAKQLMFQDGSLLSELSLRDFDYLFG